MAGAVPPSLCLRILSRYRPLIPPAVTKERGDAGDVPPLLTHRRAAGGPAGHT